MTLSNTNTYWWNKNIYLKWLVDKHLELLLNRHGSSVDARSAVDAQTTAAAP
jgi:hypothetical protein